MSKSRWKRFKDWFWCKNYKSMYDHRIDSIRYQAERNVAERLKQEESRLSRQIEQISTAMLTEVSGLETLESVLKNMIDELREVQEARLGKDEEI